MCSWLTSAATASLICICNRAYTLSTALPYIELQSCAADRSCRNALGCYVCRAPDVDLLWNRHTESRQNVEDDCLCLECVPTWQPDQNCSTNMWICWHYLSAVYRIGSCFTALQHAAEEYHMQDITDMPLDLSLPQHVGTHPRQGHAQCVILICIQISGAASRACSSI
jgi:hypothetical protein